MDLVLEKGFATANEETVSPRQSAGEFVFLNLRRTEGFTEARFRERFGSPFRQFFPQAEDLVTNDMIEETGGRIRLSNRGLLLADAIFAEFMTSETGSLEVA
jgi:oxygen-independent coproporphyrinogen-3 oxidase